jgi:hypothetical protein
MKVTAMAVLLAFSFAGPASAQVFVGPRLLDGPYGSSGGGIRIIITRGHGFDSYGSVYPIPYYPGPRVGPAPRININFYGSKPPILGPGYDDDTRGVDLDLVPLKKPLPREPVEPQPKPSETEPIKPLPGVDVSKPRAPVRPGDPGQPVQPPLKDPLRPAPAIPRPPDPLPDAREESAWLIELGLAAFRDGEYGVAAQRFRQAADVEPKLARGYFLLAQAEFAMGKYQHSAATVHAGVKIDKQWPHLLVQPRLDLYKGRDVEFVAHMKRLTNAAAANPNHPPLLFLVAHQLWFDGRRMDALALFQRLRPLAKDPSAIDAFLAAGGPGQLAAR